MTLSITAIAENVGTDAAPAILSPVGFAAEGTISGWSIDSRTVNPGDCFFALRGPLKDGHDYVENVMEKGAALAIVERPVEASRASYASHASYASYAKLPQLIVPDTLAALQHLARKTRERWGGTVVGVTGSAGKTTTKDAIASLLSAQFRTGRTIGNYNNHVGVPLSILRLPDDCRAAVIEMGMNHSGEIRELAGIAKPQIGVVTNTGWAHAEYFDNGIEGVALAKRELIEELPADGIAILNADDARVREFRNVHPGRSILFGISEFSKDAEVRAEDLRLCPDGAHFRCLGVEFESPLAGRHGVSNVLAAIAVAWALGIPPERLRDAVRTLATGKMRGERFVRRLSDSSEDITVINDCYNANPEAMRSMLEVLRGTPARRRIAVLGEMLELGREAGTLHRDTGRFAAEQGIDALLGVRGAARFMVDGAIGAGLSGSAASFFETPEEAGDFLRDYVRPGDAILFKGSRGVQIEKAMERAFEKAPGDSKA